MRQGFKPRLAIIKDTAGISIPLDHLAGYTAQYLEEKFWGGSSHSIKWEACPMPPPGGWKDEIDFHSMNTAIHGLKK